MNASESDTCELTWNSQVLCSFTLAYNESSISDAQATTCHLLLPRHLYLPSITHVMKQFFASQIIAHHPPTTNSTNTVTTTVASTTSLQAHEGELHPSTAATSLVQDEVWYDYQGHALRWQLPLGVLCDICEGIYNASVAKTSSDAFLSTNSAPFAFPLQLTVHFQNFPTRVMTPCKSLHTLRQHYLSTCKEASYVLLSHSKVFSSASPQDISLLWELLNGSTSSVANTACSATVPRFEHYKRIISRLYQPYQHDLLKSRFIPVKLFLIGFVPITQSTNALMASSSNTPLHFEFLPVQRPFEKSWNIDQVLQFLLPIELHAEIFKDISQNLLSIKVQGVEIPLDTQLQWLYNNCAHLDQFLYIIITKT